MKNSFYTEGVLENLKSPADSQVCSSINRAFPRVQRTRTRRPKNMYESAGLVKNGSCFSTYVGARWTQ